VITIATPDLVTNSYFPALAAQELGLYREEGSTPTSSSCPRSTP
jgi:hypothetical protein